MFNEALIDDAVARFRDRLLAAGRTMADATNPIEFHNAEVEIRALVLEMADEFTRSTLTQMMGDKERERRAVAEVRERAEAEKVKLLSQRRRETPVQLLGGTKIKVRTLYMCAQARGDKPRAHRGKAGTGVYPVLDQLGITDRATPGLRLRVSHAAAEANSFDAARELLRQSGTEVSHRIALRLTYATAGQALAHRAAEMERFTEGAEDGAFVGRRVVACIDGGRVRIRKARPGRPRKGGRRKFDRDWREPKVLTVYALDDQGRRDRSTPPIIDATLGDADAAFALLLYHLRRVGAHRAAHITFVADGGPWIWPRVGGLWSALGIPEESRTEIMDYFHAVERLYDFARSRPRWTEARVHKWVNVQKRRLKRGWVPKVIDAIRPLMTKAEAKKKCTLGYWRKHEHRMQYQRFRRAKLPCGSGAVESAVRRVVNMRMKSASTLWKEETAEGLLHLRAHAKAGRWKELTRNVLAQSRWTPMARAPARGSAVKGG